MASPTRHCTSLLSVEKLQERAAPRIAELSQVLDRRTICAPASHESV